MITRRTFLKHGLWVLGAPAILGAQVVPSSRRIATPKVGAAWAAYASYFDGTKDWMTRGSEFTGGADSKKFTLSLWLKVLGGDNNTRRILCTTITKFYFQLSSVNTLMVVGINTSSIIILNIATIGTLMAGTGWHHVMICVDLGTAGARHIYVDGIEDVAQITFTNDNIDFTDTNWAVGANVAGALKFNGELCEIYINLAEYLNDPTKFASGGKPISLGPTASLPTGNPPTAYYRDPYASFGTDRSGNGNNMTVTGALTEGTPP